VPLPIVSINPATEEEVAAYQEYSVADVDRILATAAETQLHWRRLDLHERAARLSLVAQRLRADQNRLAQLITQEMGKPITESRAEVNKCASALEWYATKAPELLARIQVTPTAHVQLQPLGMILAIMPWNYPMWQFFRATTPAILGGNVVLLKPASNVAGCGLAIQAVFEQAGAPGVVSTLLLSSRVAESLIADPKISAVTFTGSTTAGSSVAAAAGRALKKCVLELGGSDPFIVLPDADIGEAARAACASRFRNAGQACVAAKRFLVHSSVVPEFTNRFSASVHRLKVGDPKNPETHIGPLARADLVAEAERQVAQAVDEGATIVTGGKRLDCRGYFFEPTILADVSWGMRVLDEETFGPIAPIVSVTSTEEALVYANASNYGLGASIWTRDTELAQQITGQLEVGTVAINGIVASDPRLPFGGVKRSGFGRELSHFGLQEFMNIQTVTSGP
jgi:succinate-semialdehyde dehydrogenase / glutarate-semialdehyde dehydrogenase